MTSTHSIPNFSPLKGFFQAITWRAFFYHVVCLFFSIIGFTYALTAVSLGVGVSVTVVGLVLAASMILGARYLGEVFRQFSNALLGTTIAPPLPRRPTTTIVEFTKNGLTDGQSWRAILFFVLHLANSIVSFTVSVTFLALGLGGVSYNLWYRFLPAQQVTGGSWHRGANFGTDYFIDTPPRILITGIFSLLILLFVWPVVTVKLAAMQATLSASLLGPSEQSQKVSQLRRTQAATVRTSDSHLRSIERDLHDVTQAQLVAIAIKLGDALDRLAQGASPQEVVPLIDSAHVTSKAALTDLRGLVQGIHPAVLNSGLETALRTLTSNSPIPTTLVATLTTPLAPSIEGVAYYCTAELLNNVAKHSGSPSAQVRAWTSTRELILTVTDQGCGAADIDGLGTGLAGLSQRVSAVEGNIDIDSPTGGPTTITVALPTNLDVL